MNKNDLEKFIPIYNDFLRVRYNIYNFFYISHCKYLNLNFIYFIFFNIYL